MNLCGASSLCRETRVSEAVEDGKTFQVAGKSKANLSTLEVIQAFAFPSVGIVSLAT